MVAYSIITECARCGGVRTDQTRRHCAPCVLAWLVRRAAARALRLRLGGAA